MLFVNRASFGELVAFKHYSTTFKKNDELQYDIVYVSLKVVDNIYHLISPLLSLIHLFISENARTAQQWVLSTFLVISS